MKGEETSIGVSILGVGIILGALLLGEIGLSFPLFSKFFLGIYGFAVMVGGAYRDSYMAGFNDLSGVIGLFLVAAGPPTDYLIGYGAWSYLLVGSTLLFAIPAAMLAVYTYKS